MPALDPRDRLSRFVLRTRKVMVHSLVHDHPELLREAAKGTMTVHVEWNQKTGDGQNRLQDPPRKTGNRSAISTGILRTRQ